jgi:flotillin
MTFALPLVGVLILIVAGFFLATSYQVVPPNQAHVIVSRSKGKKVYCTRSGANYAGSSYWKVPFIQQRAIIPLENIQLKIENIPLRDQNMAKFLGDVVAWLNITDPLIAAERISGKIDLAEINSDVHNVIQAVTRNESMYSTIIDILKNRKEFSERIEASVNKELGEWGMRVIELEVIHFTDTEGYTVISDLEKRQSTIINVETRKTVAAQNKEAEIVESNSKKESEIQKANNEKAYREAQIATQEGIGVRDQQKAMTIAQKTQEANTKMVEAEKASTIGRALIAKEATITEAEGIATATYAKGQAEARVNQTKGEAQAAVTQAVGLADALALDKRAEALKKYNEAGIGLEIINATKTVSIETAKAYSEALKAAKITVYSGGGEGGMFDLKTSFNMGAFTNILKEQGFDTEKILEGLAGKTLPIANINKLADDMKSGKKKEQ